MSTITSLIGSDGITEANSMTKINTNFSNLNTDKIETSTLDTDTSLTANSDSKIATQKAVKTYVDASVNPTGRSWNEYAADAGSTDAYAITVSGVSAYTTGQTFKFKANTANTGAATLNINSLGAKTIKKDVSSDLATGDILASQIVEVIYDGTNMQLISRTPITIPSLTMASGQTTYDMSTASGNQNIAHGLGVTPTYVKITAVYTSAGHNTTSEAIATYTNSTQKSIYYYQSNNADHESGNTFIVIDELTARQTGTITLDSTNITIAWTKGGSPVGTAYILWEAFYYG